MVETTGVETRDSDARMSPSSNTVKHKQAKKPFSYGKSVSRTILVSSRSPWADALNAFRQPFFVVAVADVRTRPDSGRDGRPPEARLRNGTSPSLLAYASQHW